MPCLTERTLVDFLERRLVLGDRADVEAHLDSCGPCRRLVANVGVLLGASEGTSPPERAASDPLAREGSIGRYVLLRPIGAGAMGLVYAAYDPELDRKVALKLLHADPMAHPDLAALRARLLREAQAMAKVSHPSVVLVHDVGTFGDRVFVAMEFVDGETLTQWLRKTQRDIDAILRVFKQAGRGLAAAHAAGLVHRDFKPDNVLVGTDGRAKVTDFGLARAAALLTHTHAAGSEGSLELAGSLTRTGALVGTPAYMAPEQMRGEAADARSDLFSFCVALYEALSGERPFAGKNLAELRAAIQQGPSGAALQARGMPSWLRRAVLRGLSSDPDQRYDSMGSLLAALERDPRSKRRTFAVGALLAASLGLAGFVSVERSRAHAALCSGAEAKIAGAWGPAQKQAIREAFARTTAPYAGDAWGRVERAVDAYSAAWQAQYTDACVATRVRGEQSEALLDLRMACLDRSRSELVALTGVLASADESVVERSVQAAMGLTPVASCANVVALTSPAPLPDDPPARRRLEDIRAKLAQAKELGEAGKSEDAATLARAAVADARPIGHRPTEAEALHLLGQMENRLDQFVEAARDEEEAVEKAEAGRDDVLVALAEAELVHLLGFQLDRPDEGLVSSRRAAAALERIGGNTQAEAALENGLGGLHLRQGHYDEATAHYDRALALFEKELGPNHPRVGVLAYNLGMALYRQERLDEAERRVRHALEILQAGLGPTHPQVANTLVMLGVVLAERGDYAQALPPQKHGLELLEDALGPDHPRVADALVNLADTSRLSGDPGAAVVALQRALRIYGAVNDRADASSAHKALGEAYLALGDWGSARRELEQAFRMTVEELGKNHPEAAATRIVLGDWSAAQGRTVEALASYDQAIASLDATATPTAAVLVPGLLARAKALLRLRQKGRAVADLQRALAIDEENPGPPRVAAEARRLLAQASGPP